MCIYHSNNQNEAQDGLAASTTGESSPIHDKLINAPKVQAYRQEQESWLDNAQQLADWVLKHLVIRTDAYGKHFVRKDGSSGRCTIKELLDQAVLLRHFLNADPIIGVHTTSIEDLCRFLVIDIDCHETNAELAHRNYEFALKIHDALRRLGFNSLLLDSNGKGGFHLFVLFDAPFSARLARSFGRWLVKDHSDFGIKEPEVFPKQDSIKGKFGNFVRLFGKHHSRSFYTKAWNGNAFVQGQEAINLILAQNGNAARLIPEEAVDYQAPRSQRPSAEPTPGKPQSNWWLQYEGDLRTLDIVGLLESEGRDVTPKKEAGEHLIECPWATEHTTGDSTAFIKEADIEAGRFPVFNCFHAHCQGRRLQQLLQQFDKDAVDAHCRVLFEQTRTVVSPNNPFDTATMYYDGLRTSDALPTLFHHQGAWQGWDGKKYVELGDDDIRAAMWQWLSACSCWTKPTKTEESKLVCFVPNRSQVTATIDALKAVANLDKSQEMPSWLCDGALPDPRSVIAFQNGLLDIDLFMESGDLTLMAHTPTWFSSTCLPHQFDPTAECPMWLDFLDEVFEGDRERIDTLAQWFGYNMTWDTRQQKFAMLVGPPRSGKGTTTSVLSHVIGKDNVANPTLTNLAGQFDMECLVGKQAAIVGDGHLGRHADSIAVLERLKSIVGCDHQNVNRKYKSFLTNVVISARFTISVNEVPRLPDASAALRPRLVLLPFNRSFEGKEDVFLIDKMLNEIPGITNWALDGLRQLRKVGKFVQPKAGKPIIEEFVRASSPVMAFLDDWCDVGGTQSVTTELIQYGWSQWCERNGHEAGSISTFGSKLRAAVPGLDRKRLRDGKSLPWTYKGVGLKQHVSDRLRQMRRQRGGM